MRIHLFKKQKTSESVKTYEELLEESKKPPLTQAELSKRWYEKKKLEAEELGVPITEYLGRKKKPYDPEKRRAQYLKQKAEGTLKNYYKEAKAKDPLYNQKKHIQRKSRDIQWQTVKGDRANFSNWVTVVKHIRESTLSTEDLATELNRNWRILRHTPNRRSDESKTIYRPRITNTVLDAKQLQELDNYAVTAGLTSQHEVIRSTVSYYGDLKDIESREETKQVDVYTVQKKGKDYSRDDKNRKNEIKHTFNGDPIFHKKLTERRS